MPQDQPYILVLDEKTSIEIDPAKLPDGFDTLSAEAQHQTARKVVKEHLEVIERSQRPAEAKDFLIPLAILFAITLVIIFAAIRIRKKPKLYDTIVKLDGEPNPDYGKGWKEKNPGDEKNRP